MCLYSLFLQHVSKLTWRVRARRWTTRTRWTNYPPNHWMAFLLQKQYYKASGKLSRRVHETTIILRGTGCWDRRSKSHLMQRVPCEAPFCSRTAIKCAFICKAWHSFFDDLGYLQNVLSEMKSDPRTNNEECSSYILLVPFLLGCLQCDRYTLKGDTERKKKKV